MNTGTLLAVGGTGERGHIGAHIGAHHQTLSTYVWKLLTTGFVPPQLACVRGSLGQQWSEHAPRILLNWVLTEALNEA